MKSARIKPRPQKPIEVEPPVEDDRPPVRRAAAWFRDEHFYRDMTSQALSTSAVAVVAYIYAIAAGYVPSPSEGLVAVLLAALAVLACMVFSLMAYRRGRVLQAIGWYGLGGVTVVIMLVINERVSPGAVSRVLSVEWFKWLLWLMPIAWVMVGVQVFRRKRLKRGRVGAAD